MSGGFGTPVINQDGKKQGVLILNYLGQEILDQLVEQEYEVHGKLMLLNQRGYWLHEERPGDAWAFMWPERAGQTFGARYPRAWQIIHQDEAGQFVHKSSLYTFITLYPLSKGMSSSIRSVNSKKKERDAIEHGQYRWKLISRFPEELIHDHLISVKYSLITVNVILILFLGPVSWLLINFYLGRQTSRRELNKFKNILDQTLDCVFMFDPETLLFSYVNQGGQKQVGYTEEEFLSMTPLSIKPHYTESAFREIIAPLADEKTKNLVFQVDHQHKDGTLIPVEIHLQYVKLKHERACFVAIVRDISERKQKEKDLKAAHQRLLTVLDSLDAMVYVIDLDSYELLFLNRYASDIFGNVTGGVCWQSLGKDKEGPCDFCPNELLRDQGAYRGKSYVWERRNPFNGRYYEMHDRAIKWLNGREVKIQIATDITKRLERELINKTLATAIEQAPVSVVITDPHGIIEYVNPHLLKVSKYSKQEVVGKNPRLFRSGKATSETYKDLWAYIANGKSWHGSFINRKKGGEEHIEEIWISPVRSQDGDILNFVGVKQD
ncbi:MAG: PAS domain S-box protein, partial [Candidatus Electrothrix sp. AR3]|nr:PAS domain S-box protein [Candidatus Electrothrix sp. AR3]